MIDRQSLNFTAGVGLRIDKGKQAAQLVDAKAKLAAQTFDMDVSKLSCCAG